VFLIEALQQLPKLNSIDGRIVLQDLYESHYGIYDHLHVASKRKPLASIAMHPSEDTIDSSLLDQTIRSYTARGIRELYGLSLVDFSYPRTTLLEMHAVADSLVVLDHHKTAQADLEGLDFAHFDMDRSGAVIAWEYFHPDIPVPYAIKLIQDRDLWRFVYADTKPFTVAMYSFIPYDYKEWHRIISDALVQTSLIEKGIMLLQLEAMEVDKLLLLSHSITIGGHVGIAVNTTQHHSVLGNALAALSGTFGCVYYYDGRHSKWNYSLRSIGDYDVSVIAHQLGGGGHKNAAGVRLDRLIGYEEQ